MRITYDHAHLNFFALWQKAAIKEKNKQIYILGDWNYHFLGMKQIHWERWSRFYLSRGHPYLWSRARRVTQPQPRVYNMIREELARVKQNGAWKPQRKKRSESNFILFLFFYSIRVGPSWSEPDWWSELIRSDFCTYLPKRV